MVRRFGLAKAPPGATLKGRATFVGKYATSVGCILEQHIGFRMPRLCARVIGTRVTIEEFLYPFHNLYRSFYRSYQLQFAISGNAALCH